MLITLSSLSSTFHTQRTFAGPRQTKQHDNNKEWIEWLYVSRSMKYEWKHKHEMCRWQICRSTEGRKQQQKYPKYKTKPSDPLTLIVLSLSFAVLFPFSLLWVQSQYNMNVSHQIYLIGSNKHDSRMRIVSFLFSLMFNCGHGSLIEMIEGGIRNEKNRRKRNGLIQSECQIFEKRILFQICWLHSICVKRSHIPRLICISRAFQQLQQMVVQSGFADILFNYSIVCRIEILKPSVDSSQHRYDSEGDYKDNWERKRKGRKHR